MKVGVMRTSPINPELGEGSAHLRKARREQARGGAALLTSDALAELKINQLQ